MKKVSNTESLGNRIKEYELKSENIISPDDHMIVRIDGHKFSTFTRQFEKPFDSILAFAMIETTKDLVEKFNCYAGFTQSDEITLFIPSLKDLTVDNRKKPTHKLHERVRDDWTHQFSGRTQKITSLIAAFTTVQFNKHLRRKSMKETLNPDITAERKAHIFKMLNSDHFLDTAFFDARVLGVPNLDEVFNIFMWRSRDCLKNSKQGFARAYCSHKELMGISSDDQVIYCLEKTGKNWNDIPDMYKFGTLVKKTQVEKDVEYKGVKNKVIRQELTTFSIPFTNYCEENKKIVVSQLI